MGQVVDLLNAPHTKRQRNKTPNPVYPTWKEWRKKMFPDANSPVLPCNFMSNMEIARITGRVCAFSSCKDCENEPIPAHIAERLGIKPKEV